MFIPFSRILSDNHHCEGRVDLSRMSLRRLRNAIHNNEVTFPAQVPTFACQSRSEIQWRLVDLYFVRSWSCSRLAERYGMTMERARQIVANWVQRAIVLGYLQEVPPLASAPAVATGANQVTNFLEVPGGMLPAGLIEPLVQTAAASNGP